MNIVHNQDCMEGMRQYPDKYFELAIVDPPYGINLSKGISIKGEGNTTDYKKVENWDKTIPNKAYFDELFRVSKNQIIWGGELLH